MKEHVCWLLFLYSLVYLISCHQLNTHQFTVVVTLNVPSVLTKSVATLNKLKYDKSVFVHYLKNYVVIICVFLYPQHSTMLNENIKNKEKTLKDKICPNSMLYRADCELLH